MEIDMKVKEINWIDKNGEEASVIISDGIFECAAFSHPCHLKVGDTIFNPLQFLDEAKAFRVENRNVSITRQLRNNFWSHEIVALVTTKDENLVQIGQLKIRLNSLPGDVINGDFIVCYPSRIDIID